MYLASQLALIALYLALVAGSIAATRSKYHPAFSFAVIGAVTILIGSVLGGFLGGISIRLALGKDVTALRLIAILVFAALFEEVARIIVLLWRNRCRDDRIEDAVMFGVGFGGAEVVYRAFTRLYALATGTMTAAMTPWGSVWNGIMCVEIFVFHIFMTLLVFRAVRNERSVLRIVALGLLVLYHVGLDVSGGMTAVLLGLGYSAILWSVLTVIHIPVILRLLNVRARVPMRPIDSIA